MNRLFATLTPAAVRSVSFAAAASASRPALVNPSAGILAARSFGTFLPEADVEERVVSVLKNFEKVDPSKVTPKAHFIKDLGLDSLDTVEVVMAFEEEFVLEIPDDMAEKILTCEDAVKFISQHPMAR
jgi:NADH dehydrogenase (ubiquinone) 1 alpha/beta subcomplex 1